MAPKFIMAPTTLTLYRGRSIFDRMADNNNRNAVETDFRGLETRVEELIRACTRLRDENTSLRNRQDLLIAERATLIEKNELARSRVEAMITRLKSMETGA